MSEIREILNDMRRQRWLDDRELAQVTSEQMYLETGFTLETMMTGNSGEIGGVETRFIFLRRADHLEEHAIQIEHYVQSRIPTSRTQAHLHWAANQEARGDLYAALVGLTGNDLDASPDWPEGEWSLREILEHLSLIERVYAARAVQAVENFRAGRAYEHLPYEELPIDPEPAAPESFAEHIEDLDRARETSLNALLDLTDDDLRAPMVWVGMDIDVRFMLMRFAMHEREHTDQIRKWRQQTGKPFSEADRLLGLCWQRQGRLEGILAGAPDQVLDQDPGNDEWQIRRILAHIAGAEQYFKGLITAAIR